MGGGRCDLAAKLVAIPMQWSNAEILASVVAVRPSNAHAGYLSA